MAQSGHERLALPVMFSLLEGSEQPASRAFSSQSMGWRPGMISARSAITPLTLLAHLRRLERLAFPITLTSAIMIAKLP